MLCRGVGMEWGWVVCFVGGVGMEWGMEIYILQQLIYTFTVYLPLLFTLSLSSGTLSRSGEQVHQSQFLLR